MYTGIADMRMGFDALCGIVQGKLDRNPLSGEVFVFVNRRRNCIKLLRWEPGGFILYYKRLETGTLELPEFEKGSVSYSVEWTELMMIVQGISINNIHRKKRFINNQM